MHTVRLSRCIVNKVEYHWHWFHCRCPALKKNESDVYDISALLNISDTLLEVRSLTCMTYQLYWTFRTFFWLLECIIYLKLSVWFFHPPPSPHCDGLVAWTQTKHSDSGSLTLTLSTMLEEQKRARLWKKEAQTARKNCTVHGNWYA